MGIANLHREGGKKYAGSCTRPTPEPEISERTLKKPKIGLNL